MIRVESKIKKLGARP